MNVGAYTLWECAEGHIWQSTYHNIHSGDGCPVCYTDSKRNGKFVRLRPEHILPFSGEVAFHKLLREYKDNASRKGIEFVLTYSQFLELTTKECCYCGVPPQNERRTKRFGRQDSVYIFNGIDRLSPSEGYTYDNCVPCCKRCNYGKREMTPTEFRDWVSKVYHHFCEHSRVL